MSKEENIFDDAQKAAEEIGEEISQAANDVGDAVAEASEQAADAVEEVSETIEEQSDEAAEAVSEAVAEATPTAASSELDELVEKLKAETPAEAADSQYSPMGLMTLLQEYFPQLPADLQSRIMDLFQGMEVKDLMSIDTWTGVVTMVLYSAKAQAEQVTGKVDSVLPEPLKTSNLLGLFQSAVEKYTPSVIKGAASSAKEMAVGLGSMASNLEGMSAEDLMDPETWKGLYSMLDYGLRAQVSLLKERVTGGGGEEEGDDDFGDFDDDFDDWDD